MSNIVLVLLLGFCCSVAVSGAKVGGNQQMHLARRGKLRSTFPERFASPASASRKHVRRQLEVAEVDSKGGRHMIEEAETNSEQSPESVPARSRAPFSWQTVPLYWYSADPWKAFDDDTAAYAAEHPVVVPNGNHMRWVSPVSNKQEDKLVQVAEQIKRKNSSAKVLFYLNSMMDWTQYSLHHVLTENHQEYWMRNISECTHCVLCMRGQPIFDLTHEGMRQMWLDTMSAALSKDFQGQPLYYGVFGDRANPLPKGKAIPQGVVGENTQNGFWQGAEWWHGKTSFREIKNAVQSQCKNAGVAPFQYHWRKYKAWSKGHTDMFVRAQVLADNRAQVILANNNDKPVDGRQWEQWANDDYDRKSIDESIQNFQKQVKSGKLTLAHTGDMERPCSEGDRLALGLSAFLIAAGEQSYFSCTDGWLLNQGWKRSQRHPEFDYPLGEPVGPGTRTVNSDGSVLWQRSFATGTRVELKISTTATGEGSGCIYWSNGKVTGGDECQPSEDTLLRR